MKWLLIVLLMGCPPLESEGLPQPTPTPAYEPFHPHLSATPDARDTILARLDREPYSSILAEVVLRADSDIRDVEIAWRSSEQNHNANAAAANAYLAWLYDDAAYAARSLEFLAAIRTDFENIDDWDINISMPHSLIAWTDAHDLLSGTDLADADALDAAEEAIVSVAHQFFSTFVLDDGTRTLLLGPAQNNHPIRTAVAIGYPALAFWDHPLSPSMRDWAFSEVDYLWGENGQYSLSDGGVSEGPFYSGYAWTPSLVIFGALESSGRELELRRSCLNRNDADPWTDHGCIEGEEFTFNNPLRTERFQGFADWSMGLRLPWGMRPPREDSRFSAPNGVGLLTAFADDASHYRWDWENNRDVPRRTNHALDTKLRYLSWFDDSVVAAEPDFLSRVLPAAGEAVFRSSWDDDAVWGMLMGENGSARKTLHDHVDAMSFQVAAYGEYLLMDTGYYKPVDYNNARTANATGHNVVLIDGQGAPDKGLLTNFGDTDAWLEQELLGGSVEVAESRQSYEDSDLTRTMALVEHRFFVIADRITSEREPREHRFRVHGWAGYDSGGTFTLGTDGARWERSAAGIDVYIGSRDGDVVVELPPYEEARAPHTHEIEEGRATTHHEVIDAVITAEAPDFLALLVPYRVGEAAPVVAWEGDAAWVDDVLVVAREPGEGSLTLAAGTLETDGELVILQPGGFAYCSRCTHVTWNGDEVLSGGDPTANTLAE
jgi:hypothetical protein